MNIRGVIEGFYGPPWTHEERLDLIAFCGDEGLTTWVHAPKDDPYHRKLWREPYPDAELEQLVELVAAAGRHGVEFVYAIAPGLSIRASDEADLAALEAKREQVLGIGVRDVQLLWDDIERRSDERTVRTAEQARGEQPLRGAGQPLVVCPMGYAGSERTPYRDVFGGGARPADRLSTGRGRRSCRLRSRGPSSTPRSSAFGHELLLWDNYPVNDFDARDAVPRAAPRPRAARSPRVGAPGSSRTRCCRRCRRSCRSRRSPTGRATRTATTRSRRSSARCAPTAPRSSRRSAGSRGRAGARCATAGAGPGRTDSGRAGRGARARRRRSHRRGAAGAVRVTDVLVYGATAAGVAAAVAAARGRRDRAPRRAGGARRRHGLRRPRLDGRRRHACARRLRAPVLRRGRRALRRAALGRQGPGAARRRADPRAVPRAGRRRGRARHGDGGRGRGLRRRLLRGRPAARAPARAFAVGRESRGLYGERWAGRQPAYRPGKHNFPVRLSPFADDGSLLPFIREPELDERGWPAERLGEGDGGLQAYQFRLCLTDRPENRLPLEPPPGYDAARVRAAAPLPAATRGCEPRDLLGLVPDLLPNGKCDVNSIGPFSLNLLDGSNRDYLDGDRAADARAPPALRAGAALVPRDRGARGDPRRRSRAGARAPTSSPTPAAGRTSCTSATRGGSSASTCSREHDLLAGAARRRRRARLLQHRHPRGRAHVALPAGVPPRAGRLQRGLPLGRGAAVRRSRTARSSRGARTRRTCSSRSACRPRTSRSARCGWSRR